MYAVPLVDNQWCKESAAGQAIRCGTILESGTIIIWVHSKYHAIPFVSEWDCEYVLRSAVPQ